ncbi:hypothetical protein MNAB215_3477, partial [Mycobacterium numidiamassiliense]
VLAAVTCFAPIGFSLADPAAESAATAAVTIPFPTPLTDEIKKLDEEAAKDPSPHKLHAKKASILKAAFDNLPPAPWKSETAVVGLAHPENYQFDTSKKPSDPKYFPKYFPDNFKNNNVTVTAEPQGLYDYKPTDEIWVDFANHDLGGGVFGDGMVQEETMALSMPQLADAAAIGYTTRDHGKPGPLGSNPTPLVLTKVHRAIELDKQLYGSGWESKSLDEVKKLLYPQKPNQELNVLAVAVEKITTAQQTELDTLDDLFNTFVAAYAVAKDAKPNTIINTGPIGTGDFNNDDKVIYVMQHLAAQQIGGLNLRYWGLTQGQQNTYDSMVAKIIGNWQKDPNKSMTRLVVLAHECLTSSQNCK